MFIYCCECKGNYWFEPFSVSIFWKLWYQRAEENVEKLEPSFESHEHFGLSEVSGKNSHFNESDFSPFPVCHVIMELDVRNISNKCIKTFLIYWLLQRSGNVKMLYCLFVITLAGVSAHPQHQCCLFCGVFSPLAVENWNSPSWQEMTMWIWIYALKC